MVRKNFSSCIIAASIFISKYPQPVLCHIGHLESLDKSPEMNNRCLICNRIATVTTVKGLDVVIDNYCFPTSFCSIWRYFFSAFSIRNTGHLCLLDLDRLEGI
jgi:hypothetical protein